MKLHRLLVTLLGAAAVGLFAQTAAPDVPSEYIPPSTSQPREAAGALYLSGGMVDEERRQMLAQAARFPLRLVFSAAGGAHAVADEVTISSPQGAVFSARDVGPWLMIALPPGRYTVKTCFHGVVQQRALKVGAGVQRMDWVLAAAPA